MIVIVDYGVGNLKSIQNMLKKAGTEAIISSTATDIESADKLILPGVGAFDTAVSNLESRNLRKLLIKKAGEDRVPLLGICLGMQMLTNGSSEGRLSGLGLIDGSADKFDFSGNNNGLKIPHMGWNSVEVLKESRLFHDMCDDPRFYFVHSYHVACGDDSDALCRTEYGYKFTSAIEKHNVFGVQFHPEKSHKFGLKLLKNFAELT